MLLSRNKYCYEKGGRERLGLDIPRRVSLECKVSKKRPKASIPLPHKTESCPDVDTSYCTSLCNERQSDLWSLQKQSYIRFLCQRLPSAMWAAAGSAVLKWILWPNYPVLCKGAHFELKRHDMMGEQFRYQVMKKVFMKIW